MLCSPLSVFFLSRTPGYGTIPLTGRAGLPTSVSPSLETPSQTCPKVYALGDSRSCRVENQHQQIYRESQTWVKTLESDFLGPKVKD